MTGMKIDLPEIEWPEEWDPKEGWPSAGTKKVRGDGRTWDSFSLALTGSFPALKEALGATVINRTRTMEDAREMIRAYFEEHGKRPTERSSKDMRGWAQWLRHRNSSLPKVCEEIGIPGGHNRNRTLKGAKEAVKSFHRKHKQWPTQRSSKDMIGWNSWLKRQGTSLVQLCDELKRSFYARKRSWTVAP